MNLCETVTSTLFATILLGFWSEWQISGTRNSGGTIVPCRFFSVLSNRTGGICAVGKSIEEITFFKRAQYLDSQQQTRSYPRGTQWSVSTHQSLTQSPPWEVPIREGGGILGKLISEIPKSSMSSCHPGGWGWGTEYPTPCDFDNIFPPLGQA